MGKLLGLDIPPGFFRNGTQYEVSGRWYDGNLVRFSEGRLRPIGGWTRLSETQFINPIRRIHSYRTSLGIRYIIVGSPKELKIWSSDLSADTQAFFYDITPTAGTPTPNFTAQTDFTVSGLGYGTFDYGGELFQNFTADVSSDTLTFPSGTDLSQQETGSVVMLSTSSVLPAGLTANTKYFLFNINTSNRTVQLASSSSNATAGTAVNITDTGTGTHDMTVMGGEYYGTPREPVQADVGVPVWHIDNYGDDIIACHSDQGNIYFWDSSSASFSDTTQSATLATQLSNSPTGCTGVLATPERFIFALCPSGDGRTVQWCSKGNPTDWTPTNTNTAGSITIQTRGEIIAGRKSRYGTVIFTTADVWRFSYVGSPLQYSAERLTEGQGPLGPNAIGGSSDILAWITNGQRFMSYQGGYIKELECTVADHVFSDLNYELEGLVYAGHNPQFGEIWWLYPKAGSSTNDRYVVWSYRENHWVTGELNRSAWDDSGAIGFPIASGTDGYIYKHEIQFDPAGTLNRGPAVTAPTSIFDVSSNNRIMAKGMASEPTTEEHFCFAETGAISIGDGDRMVHINQIISDSDAGNNGLRLKIKTNKTPDKEGNLNGPYKLENDGYTDARVPVGRSAYFRVESPFDQEWRLGRMRLNVAGGERR